MSIASRKIVKRKQLSGAQKLKAYGRRAIMLAVVPEDYSALKAAADAERRPLSQYVLYYAIQAAKKLTPPAA